MFQNHPITEKSRSRTGPDAEAHHLPVPCIRIGANASEGKRFRVMDEDHPRALQTVISFHHPGNANPIPLIVLPPPNVFIIALK